MISSKIFYQHYGLGVQQGFPEVKDHWLATGATGTPVVCQPEPEIFSVLNIL